MLKFADTQMLVRNKLNTINHLLGIHNLSDYDAPFILYLIKTVLILLIQI